MQQAFVLYTSGNTKVLHRGHVLIREVLAASDIRKVGFGVANDASELERCFGWVAENVLDLGTALRDVVQQLPGHFVGTKDAVRHFFGGAAMNKPKRLAVSDWRNMPLTDEQLIYAGLDAHVARHVFQAWCGH